MWGNTLAREEEHEQQPQRPIEGAQFLQQYPPPPGGGGDSQRQQYYYEYENDYEEDGGALTSTVNLFSSAASAVFTSGGAAAKEMASQGRKAASQLAAAAAPAPTQPPTQLGQPQRFNQQQHVPSSIVPENSMLDAMTSSETVAHAEVFVASSAASQPTHAEEVFTSKPPSVSSIAAPRNSLASVPQIANSYQHDNSYPTSDLSEQNTSHVSHQYPVQTTFSSTITPVSSPYAQHSTFQPIGTAGAQPIQPSVSSTPVSQNEFPTEEPSLEIATVQTQADPHSHAVPKHRSAPLITPAELNKPSLRTPSLKVPVPRASTPKSTRQWGGFKTPSSGGLPRSRSSTPTVSNEIVHHDTSKEATLPPSKQVDDTQSILGKMTNTASAESATDALERKAISPVIVHEIKEDETKNNGAFSDKDQSTKEEDDSLPNDWTTQYDQNTGALYYFNTLTNESSWECPKKAAVDENLITEEEKSNGMSINAEVENAADTEKDRTRIIQETMMEISNEIEKQTTNSVATTTTAENSQKYVSNEIEILHEKTEEQRKFNNLDESLPEGWVAQRDTSTDRVYYYNTITNQTTWEKPRRMATHSSLEVDITDYSENSTTTAVPESLDVKEEQQYEVMRELIRKGSQFTHSDVYQPPAKQSAEVFDASDLDDQKLSVDSEIRRQITDDELSTENSFSNSSEVAKDTINYDSSSHFLNGHIALSQGEQSASHEEGNKDFSEDSSVSRQRKLDTAIRESELSEATRIELQDGWEERFDENSGKNYYFNKASNIATWERPTKSMDECVTREDERTLSPECTPPTDNNKVVANSSGESCNLNELGDSWLERIDESNGQIYYFNIQTNETTWEKPLQRLKDSEEESHNNVGNDALASMQISDAIDEDSNLHDPFSESGIANIPNDEWVEELDSSTGKPYYLNKSTNETTRTKPKHLCTEPEEQIEVQGDMVEVNDLTVEVDNAIDESEESAMNTESMGVQLPDGWQELIDETTGNVYYYHAQTSETSWERTTLPQAFMGANELKESHDLNKDSELQNHHSTSGDLSERSDSSKGDEGNLSGIASPLSNEMRNEIVLPDGWVEACDEGTGKPYFYNSVSGQTSWEKPVAVTGESHGKIQSEVRSPERESDSSVLPSLSVGDFKMKVENPPSNAVVQDRNEETCDLVASGSSEQADVLDIPNNLPHGWSHQRDATGMSYYINEDTGETSWDLPRMLTAEESIEQPAVVGSQSLDVNQNHSNIEPELEESNENDDILKTEGVTLQPEVDLNTECAENVRTNTETGKKETIEQGENNSPVLPEGWIELKDEASGQNYYLNETTQETTWNKPSSRKELGLQLENSKDHQSIQGSDSILSSTEMEDPKVFEDEADGYSVEEQHFQETVDAEEISSGWEKLIDEDTGKPYFFNRQENIASWDLPVVEDAPVVEESSSQEKNLMEKHEQGEEKGNPSVDPMINDQINVFSDMVTEDSTIKDKDRYANLPDGWVGLVDENTGQPYYFNEEKNVTRWELPQEDDENLIPGENVEGKDERKLSEIPAKNESEANLSDNRKAVLPEGWVELSDPSGNTYYFNEIEQSTTWERPLAAYVEQELKPKKVDLVAEVRDSSNASNGVKSSNDTRKMPNPIRGFASFGFGGRLCIHRPSSKGKVEIHKVNSLVASHPIVMVETKKRDHGIGGALNSANSDSVSSYIREQVNESSSDNLWSLIKIAAESEGRLRSDEGVADTSSPESAMIQLFLQSSIGNGEGDSPSAKSFEDVARDRIALEKVESLLLHGKREEAVEEAVTGNHFGLALLVAGMCGGKTFQNATKKFADKVLLSESPLYTLALLFSGNLEPPPDSALEKVGLTPTVWSNSTTALLHTWKQHLCAIISNRILGWDRIVLSLGDRLLELGDIQAAHCCYMVCGCSLSSVLNSSSRLTVIGCDHLVPMDTALLTQEGIAAFGRSEAYEWAKRKGNPDAVIQSLQAFKLAYAILLADLGYSEEAEGYVKSIRKCNASLHPPSVEFSNEEPPTVWNLSKEDLFPVLLGEFENRLLYEKSPQPHYHTGNDLLMIKPDKSLSTLPVISIPTNPENGSFLSTSSNKIENPHDQVQSPKPPRESSFGVESLKYSGDSSALQIQDASGERRPLEPLQVATKPIPSSFSAADAPSTPVFLEPNYPGQSVTTPQSLSAKTVKMKSFTSPSVGQAPNSVPIPLEATQEILANLATPSSKSKEQLNELTEEKKPREAPHSAPPDLQKLQKKGAPNSDQKRSWGIGGLRNRMTKWLNPDATTADLGGTMEAYYDEDKKVWVFPGEDPNEVAKPIGPPPTVVISKAEEVKEEEKKPDSARLDPLAALMAPPPRAVSSLRRPGLGLPPSNSMPALYMPPGATTNKLNNNSNAPPTFMVFKPNPDADKENKEEEKGNDNLQ